MGLPDSIDSLLTHGVKSRGELQRALQADDSTLSRALRPLPRSVIRMGAGRTARFGLLHEIAPIGSSWPIFEINSQGTLRPCGELVSLARDQYWFDAAYPRRSALSDGLPFFLQDLWPQGFIGRTLSRRLPELELPARITDCGELLPDARLEPPLPSQGNLDIWPTLAERAERYWAEVAGNARVSPRFAACASRNAASVARARKLLP